MTKLLLISGRNPTDLAKAVSDAIHAAMSRGMELDEAVCVVVGVAADYGRGEYGDHYLKTLAKVVKRRRNFPLPKQTK